jgi:hypothetical protein
MEEVTETTALQPQDELHTRGFESSPQLDKLFASLSKAQGQMENAKKTSDNPFYHSKYADLAEVWDCIRKPLSDNGLCLTQLPFGSDGVLTILGHESGQYIRFMTSLPYDKKGVIDAQTYGTMFAYARRYAGAAVTGLAQEDDDGNAASGKTTPQPARQAAPPKQALPPVQEETRETPASPEEQERSRLKTQALKNIGNANLSKFWLGYFGVNNPSELPTDVAAYLPGYRYLVEQAEFIKKEIAEHVPAATLGANTAKLQEGLS